MKKLIIVLICLCLIAAVIFGAVSMRGSSMLTVQPAPADMESTEPSEDPTAGWVMDEIGPLENAGVSSAPDAVVPALEAAAEESSPKVDFEAIYRLHDAAEPVLSINGKEETWGDYFYFLYTQGGQIEDYFDAMATYYGMRFSWEDPVEEGGATYAEAVVESAGNLLKQLTALETFAKENNVEVSEEMKAVIENQKQADIASVLGEDGTAEDFYSYLEGIYLSREMYDRAVTQNVLYQECFNSLYGTGAEKVTDETALSFLEDNNYLSAAHILVLFNDPESGEVRDDATMAAKKAELEQMVKDMRAITSRSTRASVFLAKAEEVSEDGGKSYYPKGYTFTPGSMVTAFEDAVTAMENYEVSDVVETEYGYHVIMRLPLEADAVVEFNSSTGEPRTAKMLAANQEYAQRLQTLADSMEITWFPGCEAPVLTDYLK